ncbi:MAG: DUF167 domain-containing protein [Candidatus Nitrosopolaris sp.]
MKLNKELYRFLGKALLAVDSEVFGWLCAEPRAKSRRTLREKHEPKHGRANREMIKKMSDFFGVPENSIYIISGQTSRKKVIEIQNV